MADSEVEAFLKAEENTGVDTQASLQYLQLASSSAAGTQSPGRIACQIEAALGEELLGCVGGGLLPLQSVQTA